MLIKKSDIKRIILETIINEDLSNTKVLLSNGQHVKFASPAHIKFVEDTLDRLIYLRDKQPRASRATWRAASRKVYGDAVNELKRELKYLYSLNTENE